MIINVSEIGQEGLSINFKKGVDWFYAHGFDENSDLTRIISNIEFSIDLFKVVKEITVKGTVEFKVISSCSLCLDEVDQHLKIETNLLLSPIESVEEEDSDVDHETYSGEHLDLNNYFREQVSLSLPFKVVCSKECNGLCPKCGSNLNSESCDCDTKWEDPRFAALKGIKV